LDNISSYDERILLQEVANGNQSAFSTLFHAWRDKLYFFLLKINSSEEACEDIIQEIFIKLWVQHESLANIDNFSAYLYRMTHNYAISAMRRMALETIILTDLKRNASAEGRPSDEVLFHKQLQEKLHEAIDHLPPQQKIVYTMSRVQGIKQEEIARQLQLSESTVKNHLTQAIKSVRSQLQDQYPITAFYCFLFCLQL